MPMAIDVQAEQLAKVRCAECGREWPAGELWRLLFADLGEVVIFCPQCAEREFASDSSASAQGY
jgi:predicted nucleic-acid-binding Zn-ribbon protein